MEKNDLISRAALVEEFEWLKANTSEISHAELEEYIQRIKNAPAVDAEPVTGETSDGYHTFNELYHHRAVLFSVIVKAFPDKVWKAKKHDDGTMYDGMFIVGIETPDGQATYHYDIEPYWDMFRCKELEFAPEWDGHTPNQAIERIGKLEPVWNTRSDFSDSWKDAKENPPALNEWVLAFFKTGVMDRCKMCENGKWRDDFAFEYDDEDITHWTELPEEPKTDRR